MFAADEGADVLTVLKSEGVSIPLVFTVDPSETKMFGAAGDKAQLFTQVPSSY